MMQIWWPQRSVACRDNADISIFYNALIVGRGDLVFGLQRLFTSVSLCAWFQVSVSSGYDLWHHLMSQTHRQTDGFSTEYMNSSADWLASWAKKDTLCGFKVIQGHRICHQSKGNISEYVDELYIAKTTYTGWLVTC